MLFSVDVSSQFLYAVEGNANGGTVTVVNSGKMRLPEGTVEDGIVRNHAAFVMALSKLHALKNFRSTNMVMTISSSSILSRRLELPPAKPRELTLMVRNELQQVVSDTTDFVYEYSLTGDDAKAKSSINNVWAYAIPKETVDEYYSIFRSVRFKPVALDTHANSVEKLFLGENINGTAVGGKSALFVGIEHDTAEIHLFSEGQRAFSRLAPVSSEEFRLVVENAGLGNTESHSLSGLDITADEIRLDSILSGAARQYVGQLAEELQKMNQFQLRRNSANPVACVYLYGSLSEIKGLEDALGTTTGLPVQTVRSVSKVKAGDINIAEYANAIGALIRL
ncbi:pilus assembly protein PilM [Ethanoligenens harbinense]|uniref:Pilus assembly protein PilM n=1 Tax=Ethanoligenens harbinense (strain DSM 18485 / JCM 12961 / CGMCC 1.5033 / YUAN-3) TaxID=663278 RepID=E6U303_ETHHY|nr:pilus assembly protein PilM [Ethanoligenens harbinense]ADU26370.1 hypothetical protein Ethha_0801 [Ethanoligenens harbinense YUAN-3]AVQ95499.1 hypothetical protein CXQ68_04140 [Ethanoligenens harbinense YUAN-3]AYF38163.1 hypothetical protein CXP51_03995 [Ethanoligenens harbinense]AYF40908.1 hypothetical protein CN246_04130 [Ethanoligenens harbinense]QCN91740.1 hypothetical protein DRA42_04135 [Ethanoligenens harbinense]